MRIRPWISGLLLLAGVGACAGSSTGDQPTLARLTPTSSAFTTTTEPDRPTATSLVPPSGADVLVATSATGFEEVEDALTDAIEKWEAEGPDTYAYRVRINCGECADRGETWVRVFDPDWPDHKSWDVEELHGRIANALDESPDRVEVAFDSEVGIPVWLAVEGEDSESVLVEEFHEITHSATPYDGSWRFVGGEIDGQEFDNPSTGLIAVMLRGGYMRFPIDCNEAGGSVDVHESFFGIGDIGSSLMGCSQDSEEAELFIQALEASTTIEIRESQLVLSGEGSVLRLAPLEQPELRGELPRTAAGETLLIQADSGGLASVFTISSGSETEHSRRRVEHTLTATDPGSSQDPDWRRWDGEFNVPEAPPGPVEVVMPDDIGVGDYQLCSPYWDEPFFCYDLLVRPPSAPWYVTAGSDGVVLHDADGTSQTVWEEPARVAFWFEELLVAEPEAGSVVAVADSKTRSELAPAGSRLLDAARIGESVHALVARNDQTVLVNVDTADETVLGGEAIEGRIAGESVILRTSATRIEARSSRDGSSLWELDVGTQEMVSSVTPTEIRLDKGRLNTDDAPIAFWQYLDTRIIDVSTGAVTDESTMELAIPPEDDEVPEPCLRAELRDGFMLCPQPDGRFATMRVEYGDHLTVHSATDVIATYVRSVP